MPVIDGGIKLDAWVTTNVSGLSHFLEEVGRLVSCMNLTLRHTTGRMSPINDSIMHELVCDTNRMVSILVVDGIICSSRRIESTVITCFNQCPCFLFFNCLALDEV